MMIEHIKLQFDSTYGHWSASVRWDTSDQIIVRHAIGGTPNEAVYKLKQNLEKVIREHRTALEYFEGYTVKAF